MREIEPKNNEAMSFISQLFGLLANIIIVITPLCGFVGYVFGFKFTTAFLKTLAGYEGSPFVFYSQSDLIRIGLLSMLRFRVVLISFISILFMGFLVRKIQGWKRALILFVFLGILCPMLIWYFIAGAEGKGIAEAHKFKTTSTRQGQGLIENLVYPARMRINPEVEVSEVKSQISKVSDTQFNVKVQKVSPGPNIRDVYILSHTGGFFYFVETWGRLSQIPDERVHITPNKDVVIEEDFRIGEGVHASTKINVANSTQGDILWQSSTSGKRKDVIELSILLRNIGAHRISNVMVKPIHSEYFTGPVATKIYYTMSFSIKIDNDKAADGFWLIAKGKALLSERWMYFAMQRQIKENAPLNKSLNLGVELLFKDDNGKILKKVKLESPIYVTE